jgi:RNA polymerase sigma-70 factor, ECF subfamily
MTDAVHEDDHELVQRAVAGDESALAKLFEGYRDRLRRMIRLRLDRRLSGRIDTSDVLQEAYLDVRRRLADYARNPAAMPFHLWLRLVTGQRLTDLHRFHLGAQMRDAGHEVSLHRGPFPQASSVSLANHLLGRLTSASKAAIRAEHKLIVQEALNGMEPIDREVLALRHLEHLSNEETAQVLGLTKSAASNRYIRALERLREILSSIPGLREQL